MCVCDLLLLYKGNFYYLFQINIILSEKYLYQNLNIFNLGIKLYYYLYLSFKKECYFYIYNKKLNTRIYRIFIYSRDIFEKFSKQIQNLNTKILFKTYLFIKL